jgi:hypothetical protein
MVFALGVVALVANVSAIERFRFIAKAIRRREKDPVESHTRATEKVLCEESQTQTPQSGQRAADIRY